MKTPSVSILVPDISSNILGAATVLGRILESHYSVEIIGPDLGGGVNPMYRSAYPYTVVELPRLYRLPDFLWQSRKLARSISGDVIIAVKAYSDTVPVALWEKLRRKRKVIVLLDEWDGAMFAMRSPGDRVRFALTHLHHPMEDHYIPLVERLIKRCDQVMSTSRWLQQRFGGEQVSQGVDMTEFQPGPADAREALKAELGVAGRKLVVFGGVVRPHKGVEEILDALSLIGDSTLCLLVVGPETEHLQQLAAADAYAPYVVCTGSRPKEEMPRYIDLADLVVLPLKDNLLSRSQVPCKVFEAMAMAKPVLASAVSDLPEILDGCGVVVEPGDSQAMADGIRSILTDEIRAKQMGAAAREKCEELYSKQATEKTLIRIIEDVVNR